MAVVEIPVLRPLLPTAEEVLPYLLKIDQARIYTNFGPLAQEFEKRAAAQLNIPEEALICTSSGTTAIYAAIIAAAGRPTRKRLAALPAFTFPATALAVEMAGYEPYLLDVDPSSWQLVSRAVASHPLRDEFGLVVPVAPFGSVIPQQNWAAFQQEFGIPVVIDGAASFPLASEDGAACFGEVPVALSFHATKSFGVGEGGCVVWKANDAKKLLTEAINFGFFGERLTKVSGTNGKMSEYHAAVGLAQIDHWPQRRAAMQAVTRHYETKARELGFAEKLIVYPRCDYAYPLLECGSERECMTIIQSLRVKGIGTRQWYGGGLATHPYFARCKRDELTVASELGAKLLGLPFAVDFRPDEILRIAEAVAAAVSEIDCRPEINNSNKITKSFGSAPTR